MPAREKVGFVGLGTMGKPMATNLAHAGFPLVVHDVEPRAVAGLVAMGAQAGGSARGVAQQAEIIITCLPDTPIVRAVVEGPDGILDAIGPGQVVVDMSTISPVVTRELAVRLAQAGADMLDAPVSGGDIGAQQATLSIMVGGKPETFQRVLPLFQAMGKSVIHMGAIGAGQVTKACNQLVVGITIEAVGEALLLAAAAGVAPGQVRQALLGGFAQSRIMELHGRRMIERSFQPGGKAFLTHKDMKIALELGREAGVPLPATSLVHELYTALMASGKSEWDHAALVTVLEGLAGQTVA